MSRLWEELVRTLYWIQLCNGLALQSIYDIKLYNGKYLPTTPFFFMTEMCIVRNKAVCHVLCVFFFVFFCYEIKYFNVAQIELYWQVSRGGHKPRTWFTLYWSFHFSYSPLRELSLSGGHVWSHSPHAHFLYWALSILVQYFWLTKCKTQS